MSILGSLTDVKYWCGEDEGVPGKHSYPQGVPGPKRFGNHWCIVPAYGTVLCISGVLFDHTDSTTTTHIVIVDAITRKAHNL